MTTHLAGCVITNDKSEVLLLHRNTPILTHWELPGGKVESEETTEQAAIREVLEEIGVHVKLGAHLGDTEFEDRGTAWTYHWFRAEILEGEPHVCEPDEHDAVRYFNLSLIDIATVSISVNIKRLIKAIENKRFKL